MKYIMIRRREEIGESEILRQMNFDDTLKKYHALKGGWSGWISGTVVVLGILAGVMGLIPGTPTSSEKDGTDLKMQRHFDTVLNASTSARIFSLPNGSSMHVPEGAFVDGNGKPVNGRVQLYYSEYHGPKDFFISGIPMTYDSAGNQYHFESGGMIEILGFQDDKPVFLAPGKNLEISLASSQPGDQFNTYYLANRDGKWEYISKDTVGDPEHWKKELDAWIEKMSPSDILRHLTKELDQLKKKDEAPVFYKPSGKDLLIRVEADTHRFPELKEYLDVQFAITGTEAHRAKIKSGKNWRDVKLTASEKGSYEITFIDWSEKYTVKARPVLSEKDQERILTEYTRKHTEKGKTFKKRLLQLRTLTERYSEEVDFDNNDKKLLRQWQEQVNATTQIIFRVFYADKFGIYNCDCPKMLPKGMEVVAVMKDASGKTLKLDKVYLVERGTNVLFTYYGNAVKDFKYNPRRNNRLWAVTADGRMATLDEVSFKKVKPVRDTCVYTLSVHSDKVPNEQTARKLLDL